VSYRGTQGGRKVDHVKESGPKKKKDAKGGFWGKGGKNCLAVVVEKKNQISPLGGKGKKKGHKGPPITQTGGSEKGNGGPWQLKGQRLKPPCFHKGTKRVEGGGGERFKERKNKDHSPVGIKKTEGGLK